MGIAVEEVLEALNVAAAYRATSLDTPLAGGDDEAGSSLGDVVGVVDQGFLRAEQRAELGAMMRSLTRTERAVVRLRFEQDLTQSEIGAHLGISQMQVSRVLRRSIAKLRTVADVAPDVVEAA